MFNINRKINYLVHSEISALYISHALRTFAGSMISVFIPIFLLNAGFSLVEITIFYLIQSIFILLFVHLFIRFAARRGVKKSMIISIPVMILFFMSLHSHEYLMGMLGNHSYLLLASLLGVIANLYYWMGLHIDFAKVHEEKKAARQVSWLHALSIMFSILGPLLGATLIVTTGFEVTFIVVTVIFAASIIPLLLTKDIHEPFEMNIKNIFSKNERKKYYPYFGEGFRHFAAAIYWPLLLYTIAVNISEIGGIFTFGNALMALVTIYIGKATTDLNKHRILNIGAILHSISLIGRTLLKTVTTIAAAQGLGAISFSMIRTPFESIHYNRSKKHGIAHIIFAREIYLNTGWLICGSAFLAALALLGNAISALTTTIILAAIAIFLMTYIKD